MGTFPVAQRIRPAAEDRRPTAVDRWDSPAGAHPGSHHLAEHPDRIEERLDSFAVDIPAVVDQPDNPGRLNSQPQPLDPLDSRDSLGRWRHTWADHPTLRLAL